MTRVSHHFGANITLMANVASFDSGVIQEAVFKTFGCGSAIASSSYMTEIVKGLSLDDASKIKNTTIAKELALPPVKLHCSSTFLAL